MLSLRRSNQREVVTVALQEGGPGAYAPAGSVTAFIERYRDRRLPAPIDADTIVRAGVTTKSLAPRTIHALKLLDLLDDKDQPTADLVALERVPSDQFKERFADILRTAYADVLKIADPAIDDYERIRDQFQLYNPPSLRDRMATLFLGLAEYAEMIPEGRAKELTGRRPSIGKPRTLRPASARQTKLPSVPSDNGVGTKDEGRIRQNAPGQQGDSRSLTLKSGGTVTLAVNVNLFELSKEDRTFVLGLIDQMSEYAQATTSEEVVELRSEGSGPNQAVPDGSTTED
jgi:hypothetical protein